MIRPHITALPIFVPAALGLAVAVVAGVLYAVTLGASPTLLLGAIACPGPCLLLLWLEFRSAIRQSRRASRALGYLFGLFAFMGTGAMLQGVLGLTGYGPIDGDFRSWREVGISAPVVIYAGLVAWQHFARSLRQR